MILDVGCGRNKRTGAIGIDRVQDSDADVIYDLNCYPYPFASSSFDRIICSHIIEHIADTLSFVNELHRLGKPGAVVEVWTPHFSSACAYADPTHVHYFGSRIFEYFAVGEDKVPPQSALERRLQRQLGTIIMAAPYYTDARFCIVVTRLIFCRLFRRLGIERFANRHLFLYEFYLTHYFPARDIYWKLEVVK